MLLILKERSGLHCLRCSSRSVLRPVANRRLTNYFKSQKSYFQIAGTSPLRVLQPLDEQNDVGLYPALNLESSQFPSAVPFRPPASIFSERRSCRCRPKLKNRFSDSSLIFHLLIRYFCFQTRDLRMQLLSTINRIRVLWISRNRIPK